MNETTPETVAPLPPHLEAIRARLEAAWKGAAPGATLPRIEDHLAGLAEGERLARLRELVPLEIDHRRQRGEQPHAKEYRARFPELRAEWLADALEAPLLPQQGPTLRCPHCHNPIQLAGQLGEEVLCPGCGGSFRVRDARFTDTASPSRPLGRFQLLERVGQGAFGAVWKARDTALDRIVALKVLHTGLGTDDQERQRFQREARAAAQLRHPGIVTVREVLSQDGLPLLVADFVQGVTLHDFLQVRRLTFRESAQLVADLAEALEYAHGMGVVHRDLKPANIMLEAAGGPGGVLGRPLLTDFGLALRDGAEVTLTLDGHVLGTPAYMSPEQAAGKSHLADRRSDIYSLGVILYELMTGKLPFRGSKAMLLYQVMREEPKPPRQLNAKVPRDLETVCLKCLQKEPHKRYQSARELADDLRRFLDGEPVLARPVGRLERGWRWCRRNPTTAGLLAGIALLLVSVATVSTVLGQVAWRKSREAQNKADEAQRAEAEERKQRELAADRLYVSRLRLAQSYWQEGNIAAAREQLDEAQDRRKTWEHCYLDTLMNHLGQRTFLGHTNSVRSVCISPGGKRLASGSDDRTVRVWDAATGQQPLTLKGHTEDVRSVVFSPDGKRIASGSGDQTVKVWLAQTGQQALTLKGPTSSVTSLCFSPDGKRLIARGVSGNQVTWSLATGRPIAGASELPTLPSPHSPDGRFFALAEGNVIRIHRLPSAAAGPVAYRWWVGTDYRWHAEQAQQSQQTGDWVAAAFHLGRQLPKRPWDAGLYARLAYALSRLGQSAKATTCYLQALLLNPHVSPWPLDPGAGQRGPRAAEAGDWPRAVADLELAAQQPRATFATWSDWLLARAAAAPKGARVSYRQLLDRFESNAAVAQQLVFACLVTPCEQANARRLLKVAERLVAGRRDAATLNWLGAALYRADRFEEAERTLQEAIKAQGKGGYVDSWLFLAMAQQRLGLGAAARTALARFERWLKGRKFATWQEHTRWHLLHEEARRLILTMPPATD